MLIKPLFILFILALVTGCATTPPYSPPKPTEAQATLLVPYPKGLKGLMGNNVVTVSAINGQHTSAWSRNAVLKLAIGANTLTVSGNSKINGLAIQADAELRFTAQVGKTYSLQQKVTPLQTIFIIIDQSTNQVIAQTLAQRSIIRDVYIPIMI